MIKHTFIPDYSVRAVSEVFYVAIKRTLYLAAKRATLMERSQKYGDITNQESMDDEVEKVFFYYFNFVDFLMIFLLSRILTQ